MDTATGLTIETIDYLYISINNSRVPATREHNVHAITRLHYVAISSSRSGIRSNNRYDKQGVCQARIHCSWIPISTISILVALVATGSACVGCRSWHLRSHPRSHSAGCDHQRFSTLTRCLSLQQQARWMQNRRQTSSPHLSGWGFEGSLQMITWDELQNDPRKEGRPNSKLLINSFMYSACH
jgi:hypothetical protein